MTPSKRVLLLVAILAVVGLLIELTALGLLYRTSFHEQQIRLKETVKTQANLIEAVARFDSQHSNNYPLEARQATLSQIIDAHIHCENGHHLGEFLLAQLEEDKMVFLLDHHHDGRPTPPQTMPFDSSSGLAQPMRMALSGLSGVATGLDYRGVQVLAAYEPIKELNLGLVAKVDLAEIRRPFIRAGLISALVGLLATSVGAILFIKVTEPLLRKLALTVERLQISLSQVKQLSGLLPICASCKKIRDDRGYWNQIDAYVSEHSEAEFSHGMCPDCARQAYAELGIPYEDDVRASDDGQVK